MYKELNSKGTFLQRQARRFLKETLCIYIGLDVHEKTISSP